MAALATALLGRGIHLRNRVHIRIGNVMATWFIALACATGLILIWSGLTAILPT